MEDVGKKAAQRFCFQESHSQKQNPRSWWYPAPGGMTIKVRSALYAAAGNTGDDLLGQEDIQQEGGQEDDDNRSEQAAVVTGILHCVDDLQKTHANGHHLVGSGEDQCHEEFIPDGQEVEDGHGNHRRLHQGQHNLPEGVGGAAAIEIGSFFVGLGQGGEEVHQVDGGVGHPEHNVQGNEQHPSLQTPLDSQGIQGHDDHDCGDTHSNDQADADGLAAYEIPTGQDISRGSGNDQNTGAGDQGIEQGVSEENGNILIVPGCAVVLPMETGFKFQNLAGENLPGGGKAGTQDPEQDHCGEGHPGTNNDITGKQTGFLFPIDGFVILCHIAPPSLIFQIGVLEDLVHNGVNHHNDQSKHHTDSGTGTGIPLYYALTAKHRIIQVYNRHNGGTLCIDGGEHLRPEEEGGGIDAPEGDRGADDTLHQRHGDVLELGNLAGTIQRSCLIEILGDTLDTADVNEHVIAHAAEDISDEHGPEFQVGTQPLDLTAAQEGNNVVQQTVVIIEHVLHPHSSQRHGADDIGHIDGCLEELGTADATGEDDSHKHGHSQRNQAAEKPDQHHILHRSQEAGAVHNLEIIAQAMECPGAGRCRQALHLEKAHDDRTGHGIHIHEQQAEDCGQNEPENHSFILLHSNITPKIM